MLYQARHVCPEVCRVCILELPSLTHSAGDISDVTDRTLLIRTAFETFSSIASSFDSALQEEVRTVAVSLYGGTSCAPFGCLVSSSSFVVDLLKDETSHVDLAGPTLQSLKSLLSKPPSNPRAIEQFTRLVHGLLSACLINIDEIR